MNTNYCFLPLINHHVGTGAGSNHKMPVAKRHNCYLREYHLDHRTVHKCPNDREAFNIITSGIRKSHLPLSGTYFHNLYRSQTFSESFVEKQSYTPNYCHIHRLKIFCSMCTSSWTSINLRKKSTAYDLKHLPQLMLDSVAIPYWKAWCPEPSGWSDKMNKLIPDWWKAWIRKEGMYKRETAWVI